jgi:hypothetical protein
VPGCTQTDEFHLRDQRLSASWRKARFGAPSPRSRFHCVARTDTGRERAADGGPDLRPKKNPALRQRGVLSFLQIDGALRFGTNAAPDRQTATDQRP